MRTRRSFAVLLAAALLAVFAPEEAGAAPEGARPVARGPSGLPLPRFVSLKAGRVNVRMGPGQDYGVAWVYTRPGLPVEVIQEYDNWRRIRDSDGVDGWVFQSLLSGKRTAVIEPWNKGSEPLPVRRSPAPEAGVIAYLEAGVLANIGRCEEGWCLLTDSRFRGWVPQERLWGVYPQETID